MPLNALWMHRLTPPWMGWMSPPAHLQLQVITGIWSTAPSCQIFCWHQMWPRENETGAGCFPAINLVSVSRVLSIYCHLGEHQERRWWQTDCCPGAGSGEASQRGKGAGAQEERDKGLGEIFLLFSVLSGVWREDGLFLEVPRDRTRGKEHNCNREIPVRCEETFFFRRLLPPVMYEWYLWWGH